MYWLNGCHYLVFVTVVIVSPLPTVKVGGGCCNDNGPEGPLFVYKL